MNSPLSLSLSSSLLFSSLLSVFVCSGNLFLFDLFMDENELEGSHHRFEALDNNLNFKRLPFSTRSVLFSDVHLVKICRLLQVLEAR